MLIAFEVADVIAVGIQSKKVLFLFIKTKIADSRSIRVSMMKLRKWYEYESGTSRIRKWDIHALKWLNCHRDNSKNDY